MVCHRESTQFKLVPVADHVVEAPGVARDRFRADLFGDGDPVGLDFAVGMVGTDGDEQPRLRTHQHALGFAAGLHADHVDLPRLRQQLGA